MRRTALVLSLLGAVLATASPAAARLHPCAGVPGALCGTVRVPLDRRTPARGTVAVHFELHRHRDRSRPPLEPLVAREGGPGYSTTGSRDSYLDLFAPLMGRHDVLLVDQRGTGLSGAIVCPRLQAGRGGYDGLAGGCARRLGASATLYGSGAAADDLAAVLDALHVRTIDLYGDSYGTYFSQAFALRHADRLRALVLDGAYPIGGFDPWARDAAAALRRAFRLVCRRSLVCHGDPLSAIARLAARLRARPLVGVGRDADGARVPIRLDDRGLVGLVGEADVSYPIYRELAAAGRALARGDRVPLLRLAAENTGVGGAGDPHAYSEGAYDAVACHDYPQLWDVAATAPQRLEQYRAARRALAPLAFAPFSVGTWTGSPVDAEIYTGCVDWPAPTDGDPPVPPGAAYPSVPTLVLNGDLDQRTPASAGRRTAAAFPHATFVEVANAGHVTALADRDRCTSVIVRRFLRTLRAGDTGCARRIEELHVVADFPLRARDAVPARRAGPGDRSLPRDRRVAAVAAAALGDALARWPLMYGSQGFGLRGGSFDVAGPYYGPGAVRFALHGVRFARDVAVSGSLRWDKASGRVEARVTLSGAGTARGRLVVRWSARARHARATARGVVGGRRVSVMLPAP